MADTQNQTWGQVYGQNIMQLAQQKYSKLLNTVYVKENVTGKTFFQDQIGAWSMEAKGGRNTLTPNNDPVLGRRMATMVDWHDNRMLDRGDELRSLSDPRSAYTIAAAQALGRKIDEVIITAALSSASYGETGSSTMTAGTAILATASSMTLARIVAIKQQFDNADVEMEDRTIVMTPAALDNLLNTTAATSADYNSVKALIRGEINTWMGFNWIMSTRLAAVSSSPAANTAGSLIAIAYQKFGICAALAAQPLVRTDERPDLSYSWQVYYELNIGAVRLEENRVVICQEG